MSEVQFLSIVAQYGPWAAIAIMAVYIIANKLGPQGLTAWNEERKEKRKSERDIYERFITQNEQMVKFIASATDSIHEMSRSFTHALDENTQQLFRMTEVVERGPHCPLPSCPFMGEYAKPSRE